MQQMLNFDKPRSPGTQGAITRSASLSSHLPSEPILSHTHQPKAGAAAKLCPPSSKLSKARSTEKHSRLPQEASIAESHQSAATTNRGASTPTSLRREPAASTKEADAAKKQAISVVAKPELYSALAAAVSAIVQQAGWVQSKPAFDCSGGISLQYHAEGQEAQLERQDAKLDRQVSRPEGQDTQLEGQASQPQGQDAGLEAQASKPEGQASQRQDQTESHNTPQRCEAREKVAHALQNQDLCPSSSPAVSGTSSGSQTSCQAQHAQRSTADASQVASGQHVVDGDEQGGVGDGSGQALAWQVQVQIQQAVEVLQAALRPSGKSGAAPAVVASRWGICSIRQSIRHVT